jgi:hypothetical protein
MSDETNGISNLTQISGSSVFGQSSIQVTELREAPDERESRILREKEESSFKRWKEKILFIISIGFSIIISGICIWIVLNSKSLPENTGWARSLLTLIIGGFIGFLTGKASK